MTIEELTNLLDKLNHPIVIRCDESQFFAMVGVEKDGKVDLDSDFDAGESCDTVAQALDAFATQFSD